MLSPLSHTSLLTASATRSFLSRGKMSGRRRLDLRPGTEVAIVLKCDQRSGRLTHGIVQSILTNSSNHPRGIKVRLTSGQVGRVQHITVGSSNNGDGGVGTTTTANATTRNMHTTAQHDDNSYLDDRATFTRASSGPIATRSLGDWLPASMTTETIRATSTPVIVIPWSCSACTYENTNMELECEMCMTQRAREA